MGAHAGALLVGVLFLGLSLYYNLTVPLWESDNEFSHYHYVRYLVTERQLPDPNALVSMPRAQDQCRPGETDLQTNSEFRQPPLYYLLGAVLTWWLPVDSELPISTNPYVFTDPARTGYNTAIHPSGESLPLRGTALAVHLLRLISGLIGLAGLIATYLMGLLLFPGRRRLAVAVMAVNAFIPQYVFSSAVVNNDILVGVLGAWCVFLCLYAIVRRSGPVMILAAAVVAGLAVLTKYTGLPLIPLVVATVAVRLVQVKRQEEQSFGRFTWQVGLLLGLAAAPVALWFARNKLLYGQFVVAYPDLVNSLVEGRARLFFGPDGSGLLDPIRVGEFTFMTFWGLFGADTIALPPAVLVVLGLICLAALAGVLLVLFDKQQRRTLRLVTVLALLFLVQAWLLNALKSVGTSEPRGRYLLPVFSTVSFLLVLGIERIMPLRWKTAGPFALCGFLLVLTLAVPPLLLRPLYAPPQLEETAALRPGESPVHARFGDLAELVGYQVEPSRLGVFEKATVTLLWRVLAETPNNYTVAVHLLDGANQPHGSLATYPGLGNFATSLWKPGDIFRDTYEVYLEPSARGRLPSLGRVKVSMYCASPSGYKLLPVADSQGNQIGDAVYVGQLKLMPAGNLVDAGPTALPVATFGQELALEDFAISRGRPFPGRKLTIDMTWRALSQPGGDYSVFAHLLDGRGETVAIRDLPLTEMYYPSSLWDPGEIVTHTHRFPLPLNLPDGDYSLFAGLYDPATDRRLPAQDGSGSELLHDQVEVISFSLDTQKFYLPLVDIELPKR